MSRLARRLMLIALDWGRPKDPPLSLGHASIKSLLDQRGIDHHSASWAVNDPGFCSNDVVRYILDHQETVTELAFGAFIWNEVALQNIMKSLRKEGFRKPIILGGPQISYVKCGLEAFYPEANIFIRGYAEEALASLMLRPTPLQPIPGVHYAGMKDVGLSASTQFDCLPSPFLTGVIRPQRFIRWETQRGCPFRCAFCQHRESDARITRRQHVTSRIEAEVAWITRNPIIQDIAVLDPVFNSGNQYLHVLDQLIANQYRGKISLQCRLEMVNDEFLDRIQQLNQTGNVVLECGLQTIHRDEQRIIDRPNNMKAVERNIKKILERQIDCEISLIFGLPKQTLASFKQTVDFCKVRGLKKIQAFPLMLLRGTPLHDRKDELGLIESSDATASIVGDQRIIAGIPHVVASPTFTQDDWLKMFEISQNLREQ